MKASHATVFYAIFLVVVLVVTGGFILRKTAPKFISPYVTAQVARDLMESSPDVVVIDVSPLFYEDGHLPGAINYPKCAISNVIMGFDKNRTLLVYCHGFGSPMGSVHRLQDAGFKYVYALQGNYGAWADAGYPVEN
jgi:rhodanese-related sulfurtransferase